MLNLHWVISPYEIYTKKGDQGKTQLFGGETISKASARIASYGDIDELNSIFGTLRSGGTELPPDLATWISFIQNDLFCIGSHLATRDAALHKNLPKPPASRILEMENTIDRWTAELSPLKNFILPGGHPLASQMHLARTVTRRCERQVVALFESGAPELAGEVVYLNRLSDFCFTAARWINYAHKIADEVWESKK